MDDIVLIKLAARRDYYKLFNLVKKNVEGLKIVIDFKVGFVQPFDVLLLTQFAIFLINNKNNLTLKSSTKTKQYFEAIGLVEFCNSNLVEPVTLEAISSYTAMPIRRIERATMAQYINSTSQYLSMCCKRNKDLTMLDSSLAELINNVYDHSSSRIGAYVFCQYYPKKNEIVLAVSDLGIGIPESINSYFINRSMTPKDDIGCVKWAIVEKNSSKSQPHNQGRGLATINNFCKANLGNWSLLTNGVFLKGIKGINRYYSNPIINFMGTVVQVVIKVDNLEDSYEVYEEDIW